MKKTVLGIVGPSGAGKSKVSRSLQERGWHHIDTDLLAREVVPETLPELIKKFGDITDANGELDRKALASKAFSSPENTAALNAIMHGAINRRTKEIIDNTPVKCGFLIDGAAIFEAGADQFCDHIIAVLCDPETRLQRVMKRDNITREQALERFSRQKSDEFLREHSDFVVMNDDFAETEKQLDKIIQIINQRRNNMSDLTFKQKNAFEFLSDKELAEVQEYGEGYKKFLDNGKTERFCVEYAVSLAEKEGFVPFEDGRKYNAGDKIYLNQKNHAAIFAVIGTESPEKGFNITAAHIDCPRLDLKPSPLYEDSGMAFFKTHYYGGLRKYQWVTRPLALCGVVCKRDGTTVKVNIGSDKNDPAFMITDLLPHLGKDQAAKPLSTAITGEGLNVVLGSVPDKNEEKDSIRENILRILNEKYGIKESDFMTAELSVVPAENARDIGFDKSLIGSYGHDDRVCAYPCLTALFKQKSPKKTCVAVFADKEEIGSVGITGLRSDFMTNFLLALCDGYNSRVAFANSAAISADVSAAFDPNFADVYEKHNSSFINCGPAVCKYTGHGGKSGASDATAEFLAKLCGLFDRENVLYQFGELGKVDQGGGGTVSQFIADRNIEVLDIGVAMLCMHAPCELAAKADVYMLDRLCNVFYSKF